MIELSPLALNTLATLLLVMAAVRVQAGAWNLDLWLYGATSLALTVVVFVGLLSLQVSFHAEPVLVGVVVLEALVWAALARKRQRPSRKASAVSAALAVLTVGVLVVASLAYQWWMAPVAVLGLIAVGAATFGLFPWVRAFLGHREPAADKTAVPVSARGDAGRVEPRTRIVCTACGLEGRVPASAAGRALSCPRCKATVRVPGVPAAAAESSRALAGGSAPPSPGRRPTVVPSGRPASPPSSRPRP